MLIIVKAIGNINDIILKMTLMIITINILNNLTFQFASNSAS